VISDFSIVNSTSGFWWGNLRERDHLEDPGGGGRIILIWLLDNYWIILNGSSGSGMWGHELDRAGSGLGQVAGNYE
jgi:hypothetical protein